jgi:hypothetical protein
MHGIKQAPTTAPTPHDWLTTGLTSNNKRDPATERGGGWNLG